MSQLIPVVCVWPELMTGSESSGGVGLPLPQRSYAATPRNATLAGDLDYPLPRRRSRFKTSYSQLNVEWKFKTEQYDLFQNFFNETLGNGTAIFRILLRYPENSGLTYWNVRFLGDYSAEWLDGRWSVKAILDLVQRSYTEERASLYGTEYYSALADESTGSGYRHYLTSDGRHYTVITT